MKTKKMITLLAALLVGVLVNAQSTNNQVSTSNNQLSIDQLKIYMTEYGSEFLEFFSIESVEQSDSEKDAIENCKKEKELSKTCASLLKRGVRPILYIPKHPDGGQKAENTQ